MQITVQFKIVLNQEEMRLIESTTKAYIELINQVVSDYVAAGANLKYSSKDVIASLPSAVKNQAI